MTDRSRWRGLLARFSSQHILVTGDVMLDRYWYGDVKRISPEAPVVIVSQTRSVFVPGGAANTAANIRALGGRASLIGVVGTDEAASQLASSLASRGITDHLLIPDASRPTTVKTRVVAHQQHVVRIDEECAEPVPTTVADQLQASVRHRLGDCGGMILSDYSKGALTDGGTRAIIAAANAAGIPVFVDPKGRDAERYAGATLLKPNRSELSLLTGLDTHDHASTVKAAESLARRLPGTSILVTEGAEGMTLIQRGAEPRMFPAHAKAVFDVTGAGDTVIAAVALSCAAGADLAEAAELATVAAARVVEKIGTDVCTLADLSGE